MQEIAPALSVLTAMITPAVLISACGTLILSTSLRLGRIVDRVRELSGVIEHLCTDAGIDFAAERRAEAERQLTAHAQRGRLIQRALTSFYIALGLFVATTVSIGLIAVVGRAQWLPSLLGIVGTVVLFYGCMLLIAETRLALRSVNAEMQFILTLPGLYQARGKPCDGR
jgi:hypothetical protein